MCLRGLPHSKARCVGQWRQKCLSVSLDYQPKWLSTTGFKVTFVFLASEGLEDLPCCVYNTDGDLEISTAYLTTHLYVGMPSPKDSAWGKGTEPHIWINLFPSLLPQSGGTCFLVATEIPLSFRDKTWFLRELHLRICFDNNSSSWFSQNQSLNVGWLHFSSCE